VSRTPVLAANWKMFKTNRDALAYVRELSSLCKPVSGAEIVVAPPFTSLATVVEAARNTNVGIAVQNIHFEKQGAFTGEVSAEMAKDAGAEYAIIGHSERRRMFGDTDETPPPPLTMYGRKRLTASSGFRCFNSIVFVSSGTGVCAAVEAAMPSDIANTSSFFIANPS